MGFKYQTKLQSFQSIENMCTEKSNKSLTKSSDVAENPAPKVTDFSISRILSGDNSIKSDKSKSVKKISLPTDNTILDLSKHATPTNNADFTHTNPYPVPMYNYGAIDLMAATKFYAQFFPPRVNLPLANSFPMATNIVPPIFSTFSAAVLNSQKTQRYFAPYVFNSEYLSKYACADPSAGKSNISTHSYRKTPSNASTGACTRINCSDCLRDYYSQLSHRIYSGPKSPLITADRSTASRTKSAAELQVNPARSISLTTITNLNFAAAAVSTQQNKLNPASNLNIVNPASNSAEEISYKCYICDKVFGCSQTLQVSKMNNLN